MRALTLRRQPGARYWLIWLHCRAGHTLWGSDVIRIIANGGTYAHFGELLQIVGECAALPLELEAEKITIADGGEPGPRPRSKTLQSSMLRMITDERAAATLEIATNLTFGLFGQPQRFNAVFALDVADGVREAGVALTIHEMWENYTAQGLPGPWRNRFGPAHQAALGVEAAVVSELAGQHALDRVASVQDKSTGRAVTVLDYRRHYVVISPTGNGSGATRKSYSAARHDRRPLRSFTLAGAAMTDPANQKAITEAVETLKVNPRATAGITGGLASRIRNEIAVRLNEDYYLDATRPELGLEKEDDKGKGADLGDLRSFADSAAVTDDAPHGQIIIAAPA